MNVADARRTARHELADHAVLLAQGAEHTADENARDPEGARDARRMARAYRDIAALLDPAAYPRSPRRSGQPENVIPLFSIPLDERTGA